MDKRRKFQRFHSNCELPDCKIEINMNLYSERQYYIEKNEELSLNKITLKRLSGAVDFLKHLVSICPPSYFEHILLSPLFHSSVSFYNICERH